MRLLPLPKHTNGIVNFTTAAWTGAVAFRFLEPAPITRLTDSLSHATIDGRRFVEWGRCASVAHLVKLVNSFLVTTIVNEVLMEGEGYGEVL